PQSGERVAGGHRRGQGRYHHACRQERAVEERRGEVRAAPQQPLEVPERRRPREPERSHVHPVEIRLALEGRQNHPEDRKESEDEERDQPRVDERLPFELSRRASSHGDEWWLTSYTVERRSRPVAAPSSTRGSPAPVLDGERSGLTPGAVAGPSPFRR